MDTNNNTQQLHTFAKGMIADISDALIGTDQYRMAKNLRYVTDDEENTSELHMIEGARYSIDINEPIMASTQIRQYGVLITGTTKRWSIRIFENPYWDQNIGAKEFINIKNVTTVFGPCTTHLGTNKPSLVTAWEDEDNVKLYIADGENPLMSINILSEDRATDIKYLTAYSSLVFTKPIFCGLISGKLKAGLVEYSYQFYTKHGHQSEISPSTRLIPLHTGNTDLQSTNNIAGYEQGVVTDKGVKIRINIPEISAYGYDHIKVYRITYIENGQLPTIEVFYDHKIPEEDTIEINDIGQQATELLSLEEYNSMSGIHIIPRVIESKNDYMFASNIKDVGDSQYKDIREWQPLCESTYKLNGGAQVSLTDYLDINKQFGGLDNVPAFDENGNYGGTGNVSWRFVTTTIDADMCTDPGYIDIKDNAEFNNTVRVTYIEGGEAEGTNASDFFDTNLYNTTYANPSVAYYLKSLKRDEIYRYGIILYDDMGNKSAVKWIADIRVPSSTIAGFEPFVYDGNTLKARPIGVEFKVENLPPTAVAYEIVRCGRTMSDIATITQGVLSRPIKRISDETFTFPYTPTGFLTMDNVWTGSEEYTTYDSNESKWGWSATNFKYDVGNAWFEVNEMTHPIGKDNTTIFQFVSPEVCYQSDTLRDMVDKQDLKLVPLSYLYPSYDTISLQTGGGTETQSTFYVIGNKYARLYKNKHTAYFPNTYVDLLFYGLHPTATDWARGVSGDAFEDRKIRDIADRYDYIKLYNRLIASDTPAHFTYDVVDIDQFKPVITYKWDEFAEKTTNGDDVTYNTLYNTKPTSIGGDNFNNWVVGGSYDMPWKKVSDHDPMYWANNGGLNDLWQPIMYTTGPGGKCFALSTRGDVDYHTDDVKFGTVLCNIRQNVVPYGGQDETARETCSYNSYGNYFAKNSSKNIIFDGDCFLFPFEYVSQHKCYFAQAPNLRTACIIYALPIETNINLAYTYGYEFSKNRANSNGDITNIQVEADNVNNKFTQYKDLYLYNGVYSANSSTRVNAAQITTEDPDDGAYDYRTYFSNKKSNDEPFDNWTKFMPANYLDVDTRYGAITGLRRFHNQLIFWQEEKTGMFSVEERAAITDDNNMPLILGTGGVLSRYDYMATSNGMHKDQFCDTQSDSTLYWWDYNKHELCAHSGGGDFAVLSKVKMIQNLFNSSYNNNALSDNPVLAFDKRFNELIAHVDEDRSVVYSEAVQAFTGVYDIKPEGAVQFADRLFLTHNKYINEWNQRENGVFGLNNEPLFPYLKYVANENGTFTKVFDNAEFGGRVYGGDKDALRHLHMTFSTPLKQRGILDGDQIENREYNFRYVIPRAEDRNGNNSLYGDRLRGKIMQCELRSDSNDYDFSLQFIKTKYRISWS